MQAGTHLIILDDGLCDGTNAKRLSDPTILNYYRQFLIEAEDTFDFEQEGLKRKVFEALSSQEFNGSCSFAMNASTVGSYWSGPGIHVH